MIFVNAYPEYQLNIPNGKFVPNWPAVGHINWYGGVGLNQFGRDFQLNNHTWTLELCLLDSNGNGLTNGQELGDPDCIWTFNKSFIPNKFNITNPGITTLHTTIENFTVWIHIVLACMGVIFMNIIGYSKPKNHRKYMQRAFLLFLCCLFFVPWNFNDPHGILGFIIVFAMFCQISFRFDVTDAVHSIIGKYLFLMVWSQLLLGYTKYSQLIGSYSANVFMFCFVLFTVCLRVLMKQSIPY